MAGNILFRKVFRTLNRVHIFIYRSSGGRILGRIAGSPVLLLTTTGRKTGKSRTVPLVYASDGQTYAVIASDRPAWHLNLKNTPQVSIEVRKQTCPALARDASGEEAALWWARIVAQSPAFKSFAGKSNHQIVILEPGS